MKISCIFLIVAMVTICLTLQGQTLNDYRSKQSGQWNQVTTWERYDGAAWVAAAATPANTTANVITIRNGHTITVTANVSIDQTILEAGGIVNVSGGTFTVNGTAADPDMRVYGLLKLSGAAAAISGASTRLYIENGGVYEHARNGGAIPLASWLTGSTCELTGLTATDATNITQAFYNLTWNNTGQTANITSANTGYRTVTGTCKVMSTGAFAWVWTTTTSNTKNFGKYLQTGGTVSMSSGTANKQVYLTGDFTMTGGILTETGTGTNCGWNFQKPGTALYDKSGGTISQTIYFKVISGTTLDIVNQPLTGAGAFTLNSGASLIIRDVNGITESAASGIIQVTGVRTYSSDTDYYYYGTVAQSSGDGLPASVNELYVDNPAGLTFTNPVAVNGRLHVLTGSVSGNIDVDGFEAVTAYHLSIAASGDPISGFSVSRASLHLMPNAVNHKWTITGTYAADKEVTIYWDAEDDNYYNWQAMQPVLLQGGNPIVANNYDVASDPRWITVTISGSLTKADYYVTTTTGIFLPVELSSFTAVVTAQYYVELNWVTQSETGVSGYYLYRNDRNDLTTAIVVSPMIPATNTTNTASYRFTDEEVTPGTWYYWLQNVDLSGGHDFHGPVTAIVTNGTDGPGVPEIPLETSLQTIFPNPFNPLTNIMYGVKTDGQVSLEIYNIRGQRIRTLVSTQKTAGNYRARWDGKDDHGTLVTTGVYYVKMTAGKFSQLQKVVLKK